MTGQAGWPIVQGFEVQELIGRGGFGAVWRARQVSVDRIVALKILAISSLGNDTERRFRTEAKAVGGLSWHPNVVSLYDVGVSESQEPFLIMELVPGGSLGDQLRGAGALDPADVVSVGHQIGGALAAAHEAGVLHRDVKPDNILLGRLGAFMLTDFGIASLDDGSRSTTGGFSGTYAYSAPELLQGERATVASDVYSLGATLHALVSGRAPFAADTDATPAAALVRILEGAVADLPATTPEPLRRVIKQCMAREPGDRFSSAAGLVSALDGARAGIEGGNDAARERDPSTASTPRTVGAVEAGMAEQTVRRRSAASTGKGGASAEAQSATGASPTVRRTSPLPDAEPHAGTIDAPFTGTEDVGSKRSRWRVAASFILALLSVAGVVVSAILWSARGTYYVGFEGDRVTLFQGRPGGVLWINPKQERVTTIEADDLPQDVRVELKGAVEFGSRESATQYIVTLQALVDERVAAEAPTTTTTTSPQPTTIPGG